MKEIAGERREIENIIRVIQNGAGQSKKSTKRLEILNP